MSQIFVSPGRIDGDRFTLDPDQAHHVIRVLRSQPGEELQFFDGAGRRFRGQLTSIDSGANAVSGKILAWNVLASVAARFVLVQGLPKGAKWDYVIEKATELGADEIIPFLGETSPIRLDEAAGSAKAERWNRVAQAAAKQCDRSTIPTVAEAKPLFSLQSVLSKGTVLVCSLNDGAVSIAAALSAKSVSTIYLVVGPEGGFSDSEIRWLKTNGAQFVTLGRNTLRTETAGLVALTLARHALGEL